jgi:predicted nuclease of predicted toxin-antitoxin system
MRFLADESCDFTFVRVLRAAGHDVLAVAESSPGVADAKVIALAHGQRRILITEDKDFGQLVFAAAASTSGVIYVRYPMRQRSALGADLLRLVEQRGEALTGAFAVVEPGRIRISRIP